MAARRTVRTVPLLLELGRSSGSRPPMITCQCAWWWLVTVRVDGVSLESVSGLRPGRLSWGQNRLENQIYDRLPRQEGHIIQFAAAGEPSTHIKGMSCRS